MGDIFVLIMLLSFNSGITSINQEFFSLERCNVALVEMNRNLNPSVVIRSQGCYKK